MRITRIAASVLVGTGTSALWIARHTPVARRVVDVLVPRRGTTVATTDAEARRQYREALHDGQQKSKQRQDAPAVAVSSGASLGSIEPVAAAPAAPLVVAEPDDASDAVEPDLELVDPEPLGATLSAEVEDDATLVEAERDMLTVAGEPGEGHRRRNQTAGREAREVAAAQVRMRRNGSPV